MNTYAKYCPNVFVAKCQERHERGEVIEVSTKYGKNNECIVYNLVAENNGYYFYSIVRADGFNSQRWAENKAEKKREVAANAGRKADEYFDKSEKDADFLSLCEPIKIGHHSEARHRKMITEAQNNTRKMCEQMSRAEEYERKAEYWDEVAQKIDLSMPESIEYFRQKLAKAKEYHEGLKSGKYPKEHMYSMTYAKKTVNELQKIFDIAVKLWGK